MNVGDKYHGLTLLAYCGGGAFGEVFYCEDCTHKKMAVKIINKTRVKAFLFVHWWSPVIWSPMDFYSQSTDPVSGPLCSVSRVTSRPVAPWVTAVATKGSFGMVEIKKR